MNITSDESNVLFGTYYWLLSFAKTVKMKKNNATTLLSLGWPYVKGALSKSHEQEEWRIKLLIRSLVVPPSVPKLIAMKHGETPEVELLAFECRLQTAESLSGKPGFEERWYDNSKRTPLIRPRHMRLYHRIKVETLLTYGRCYHRQEARSPP